MSILKKLQNKVSHKIIFKDHSIIPTFFFVGMISTQLVPSNVIKVLSYMMLVLFIFLYIKFK
jgi:hypothetical protein